MTTGKKPNEFRIISANYDRQVLAGQVERYWGSQLPQNPLNAGLHMPTNGNDHHMDVGWKIKRIFVQTANP